MSQDETPTGPIVVTWDYEDFTTAEWYFETARAYLESGILIYQQIGHALPLTYHHARSAKFLCDHALELFLKATELQADKQLTGTHDLGQLYREFIGLCPGERFQFEASIHEMVKQNPERPASEYARYPTAKGAREWPGGHTYQNIGVRIEQYKLLLQDFDRLKPLIKDRHPDK
jgi:hypothetical protein